jgi:hypothetical protein
MQSTSDIRLHINDNVSVTQHKILIRKPQLKMSYGEQKTSFFKIYLKKKYCLNYILHAVMRHKLLQLIEHTNVFSGHATIHCPL